MIKTRGWRRTGMEEENERMWLRKMEEKEVKAGGRGDGREGERRKRTTWVNERKEE